MTLGVVEQPGGRLEPDPHAQHRLTPQVVALLLQRGLGLAGPGRWRVVLDECLPLEDEREYSKGLQDLRLRLEPVGGGA